MKTLLVMTILFSLQAYSRPADPKESSKKDKMDYGDKQLLHRDACRKPMEALETKYPDIKKEELEKMKSKCDY